MTNPIATFMVTTTAAPCGMLLRPLMVLAAAVACAFVVTRLARMTPWSQCLSLLLASFLFLDSDARSLAAIVLLAHKVVVPLAWWSFRHFAREQWVAFCRAACCEFGNLLLVALLVAGRLYGIQKQQQRADDAASPILVRLVLALLLFYLCGKLVVARAPGVRRQLRRCAAIVAGVACAAVLGCAAPMVVADSLFPMAAAVHLVLDALYARWLWRQLTGYLRDRLRAWLLRAARGAAAAVALCLAVILCVWFATIPKKQCCVASLWTFAMVGHLVWVSVPLVGRRLVRVVVAGRGVALAVRDARRLDATVGRTINTTAVRRSPRLAGKPRVNYAGMM